MVMYIRVQINMIYVQIKWMYMWVYLWINVNQIEMCELEVCYVMKFECYIVCEYSNLIDVSSTKMELQFKLMCVTNSVFHLR